MKKVSYILAAGLLQQPEITTNLAQAIELNPNLGTFLADPTKPNPSFEEVEAKFKARCSNSKELLGFSFELSDGFSWNCEVKYQYPVFYKTEEDANQHNNRYQYASEGEYTIAGTKIDTTKFTW